MNLVQHTFETLDIASWIDRQPSKSPVTTQKSKIDLLYPLRKWLDNIEIENSAVAHRICKIIPSQCPFEREITLFGRTIVKIPPMCKLNPFYNEVIALRFRAICYLADTCGEDVSVYC